jgi:L-2-hydroxyglutarate oxidase
LSATLAFCAEHGVPARQCGKLIVATNSAQTLQLRALAARAADNGLACLWQDKTQIAAREPSITGDAALYVAQTGIADYAALCRKLAELLVRAGVEIRCSDKVLAIQEDSGGVCVDTPSATTRTARLVVCAGLQADRLARLAGLSLDLMVVPFRGDYFTLPAPRSDLVSTLIYPVPEPRLPFLGVHLTLTTNGRLTLGPSAMLAAARERYTPWAFNARDFFDSASYPGTWRLMARFPRAGALELSHALSRRMYLREARRFCPELQLDDLQETSCGIRAQLVNRRGEMVNDFLIRQTARSVHVLNAPSPAATSAFPIAEEIARCALD